MSALEDVFQKSLMELRRTEIKQAYCVNILDSLIETLFSASSSMVRKATRSTGSNQHPCELVSLLNTVFGTLDKLFRAYKKQLCLAVYGEAPLSTVWYL
ncbi:hypothetical protein HPB48_009286 [Haemaphysalis longicornis]|uniref:Uncharacterized protein n=1 Tax=Haemaphysalis longicornis TaxID=44386 RepID=A0A9J6H3R4_HAELO|nr:hypothetical protein HPB48_009286 [Haemaphysalis longicornis]